MLDMGFAEDIETILDRTPPARQTVLFSATMPPRIRRIVDKHLTDPTTISVGLRESEPGQSPQIRQIAYVVDRSHKTAALGRILDVEQPGQALVFCRTRADVDQLAETLNGRGYRAEALHGGLSQEQRTKVLGRLRAETADLLIATDVAARGLDIDTLTHVVNFDVPSAAEAYVHRIGRVGRAGRQGTAITLAQPREHRMLKTIERLTKQPIEIATVPTVADLRARRLELTRAALHESLVTDDLEPFRVVLDTLSDEFDVMNIALAAIKLAHEATSTGGDEDGERDIPQLNLQPDRKDAAARGPRRKVGAETARIYVNLGRAAQVRPQDPRRRDHRRDQAQGSRDRDDRDHGPLQPRRGPRRPRRGSHPGPETDPAQGPQAHRAAGEVRGTPVASIRAADHLHDACARDGSRVPAAQASRT